MTKARKKQSDAELITRAAAIVRGLLAEPTGNPDHPYRPVILRSAGRLEKPEKALQLDPIDAKATDEDLRKRFAEALAGYQAEHKTKPRAVRLSSRACFRVERVEAGRHQDPRLAGKVAVVTGAAGAIGYGICKGLLDQGCHVVVTDLPGERLDQFTAEFRTMDENRTMGAAMDVTDAASVAHAFDAVTRAWGGVDVVVINAGIALACPLAEIELEAFRRLERVNVEGTLLTLQEAGRRLARQNTGGDIVLVSTKNVYSPGAGFGAYSATKAGSHQLGRLASLEFAPMGVRVNMVAPDAVFSGGGHKSGLWAEVGPGRMKARGLDEKGLEDYYKGRNLLKMKVTAEHVANAVLFFVRRETPTTGACIPVDGGLPDATPR